MAQPNSFQSQWFSQGENYFEHGQSAPPKQPWGGSRELPGLSSSRSLSSSIYSDPKHSPSSHAVPSMNLHRNNSDQGFDNIRLSPIANRVQNQHISDPLSRFWAEEGPWHALRPSDMSPHSREVHNTHFQSPNVETYYRHGPNSIGSSDTGHTQDSGYVSTAAYSAGLEPDRAQLQLPDLEQPMNGIHFPPPRVVSTERDRLSDPGQGHHHRATFLRPRSISRGSHGIRRSPPEKCPVPGCNEVSKCPSDAKKHRLKHEKPFKCQIPGCKRQPGFTTINDLQRHQKSVHKLGGATKSYKCAASQCKNKDKEWPRLDNFKQHVVRMHPDEELEDVIKRSECGRRDSRSQTPRPLSLDNALAGMDDISKHLTLNTSPSGYLSPEQGRSWESVQSTPSEYEARRNGNYTLYEGNGYNHDGVNLKVSPRRSDTVSTASSSGLNALAAVAAASRNSVDKSPDPVSRNGLPPEPSVSNNHGYQEPDNKRQKQALNPLAKAIAEGITLNNSNNESLEEQVLKILTRATTENRSEKTPTSKQNEQNSTLGPGDPPISVQNPRMGTISHAEVRAGLATLADLMKKQKWKRPSTSRNTVDSSLAPPRTKQCSQCDGTFFRACDLRKHERRHLKPYGCTYPKCNKVFGSKSDWKRHENSQHFQGEVFRCQIRKPSAPFDLGPGFTNHKHPSHFCGELFHRREDFSEHLKREHQLSDEDQVQSQLRVHRIGRNGQSRFWCGFCGDIIELKQRRALAWDERFNHIDAHFMKDSMRVENWWCMEAGKTKGEVKKAMDKNNFEDEDVGAIDADDGVDDDEDRDRTPEATPLALGQDMGDPVSSPQLSKKRKRYDDELGSRKHNVVIFCCRCRHGPYHNKVYSACITCEHELCPACDSRLVEDEHGDLNYDIAAQME